MRWETVTVWYTGLLNCVACALRNRTHTHTNCNCLEFTNLFKDQKKNEENHIVLGEHNKYKISVFVDQIYLFSHLDGVYSKCTWPYALAKFYYSLNTIQ